MDKKGSWEAMLLQIPDEPGIFTVDIEKVAQDANVKVDTVTSMINTRKNQGILSYLPNGRSLTYEVRLLALGRRLRRAGRKSFPSDQRSQAIVVEKLPADPHPEWDAMAVPAKHQKYPAIRQLTEELLDFLAWADASV